MVDKLYAAIGCFFKFGMFVGALVFIVAAFQWIVAVIGCVTHGKC